MCAGLKNGCIYPQNCVTMNRYSSIIIWMYDSESGGECAGHFKVKISMEMKVLAHIHTPYMEKFGIPRQSGLVPEAAGEIVFEPEYRNPDAVRGIGEFSHLWLLWEFSESKQKRFSATVAPPRLGGKERRGVFATRSPFRPNPIGLSSVRLLEVRTDDLLGPVLVVSGADLLNGTPIYDIKPYLPYTDCHANARGGFGEEHRTDGIEVCFPQELLEKLPESLREAAFAVLRQDPRAAYNKKPDYVYGMAFGGYDIRFAAQEGKLVVRDVVRQDGGAGKVK